MASILLAVDDKPDNLYVLQSLISEHLPDCRILTASNAKEGLAAGAETDFDDILIDVQMPGTSGIEMCRRLKSDERTAHMPVIMITAHSTESKLKAEALQAGADDFLTRPIDNIELVARIKVMLRTKRAQDAMPDGGELIIETTPVELDESYAVKHKGVTPGSYVMLVFSDTGCGMDAETREHIFEPFFTTKSKDKGTGLGLSTAYGIVKQHGGNIWVYSEPGLGSTFKIYLPVSTESPDSKADAEKTPEELCGSETILLVEDNEPVRNLTLAILKQKGYTVLVAENGKEALAILDLHDGPLHLLLTDVIMPQMNGKQLFEQVSGQNPDVKALYMSGYTEDVIAYHGVMDPDVHFIQKPFAVNALAAKVRQVLDD